ncbi:hypothetical protein V8C37DRAFT_378551 [Trichoderma ceciliae]
MVDTPDIQYIDRTEAAIQSSNGGDATFTFAKSIKLGDFSKLFSKFLNSAQHGEESTIVSLVGSRYNESCSPGLAAPKTARLSSTVLEQVPGQLLYDTSRAVRTKDVSAQRPRHSITNHTPPYDVKPMLAKEHSTKLRHGMASSPSSSPSSSSSSAPSKTVRRYVSCQSSICGRGRRLVGQPVFLTTSYPKCPECSARSRTYQLASREREKLRLIEEKHRVLMMDLVPYRVRDAALAEKYSNITSQGIHVFVDMSNIDIGYQSTLKGNLSLDESTRFSPLPHLNLRFLTELLVRDRPVVALNVCCSTVPGRSEPRYVQQLRELGYHIDLRERKRVEGGLSSTKTSDTLRYVEDLVDETLQVRIAESVMEYFQKPGTIVLATGDAKPSAHSDGFFSYMQRALRMGWNVEVVSWRGSLSLRWTDRQWTSQWHDKFRVIELDEFLEILT